VKKRDLQIYGDLIYEYKPTIRSLLMEMLQQKLFNMRVQKEDPSVPGAVFRPQQDELRNLPLKYLAIVENSSVVEMIRINENTAGWLLKDGVSLVEFDPKEVVVNKGMKYDGKGFVFEADVKKEDQDFVNTDTTYDRELKNEEDKI
jgi:hypothetical protein